MRTGRKIRGAHRGWLKDPASVYDPRKVVSREAIAMLAKSRMTWAQMMRERSETWLQEQLFALEWLGLADWRDCVPAHHGAENNNRGSLTGTWGLTTAGHAELHRPKGTPCL